jgi:hypothetical protein
VVARISGTRRLARVDDKRRGRHLELDRFAAAAATSLDPAAGGRDDEAGLASIDH